MKEVIFMFDLSHLSEKSEKRFEDYENVVSACKHTQR